jgi:outer membrane protein
VKRSVIVLISLAALAGSVQVAGAQVAAGKIGVVNTDVLLQSSPQFRAAQEALQAEFAPDLREIQAMGQKLTDQQEKLRKDAATMTAADRAAAERALNEGAIDYEARQKKTQDKANVREEEEMTKVRRAVLEEVHKYARANGYDLILSAGVLFAAPTMDVTAPVLEALKATRPTPAAPAATPARPATP